MATACTWEELARATLRRQFPRIRGRGRAGVVELVRRVGPIQAQVPRSPFVTVSSRLPGASNHAVNAAYEALDLVRGSNLRGTVHTCVRDQHAILDTVARRTLTNVWRRGLKLSTVDVDQVRAEMERFATGAWRSPEELRAYLTRWLAECDQDEAVEASRTSGVGRSMAHGHSALIRRPLSGPWDRRTAPGYRLASEVLDEDRRARLADPDAALVELIRIHLAAFGPASRRDIAWWTGEGLRRVDTALTTVADELSERLGPRGDLHFDLLELPPGGSADPGVRLLPEFDGLLLGYAPAGRERFLDADHLPLVWGRENGVFSCAVLADGRLCASWKLLGTEKPAVEVARFPGTRRLDETDVGDQIAALESALDVRVEDVRVVDAAR